MPEERMHPLVYQTILRSLGYGWGTAIIQDLIRFRFDVKISLHCLNTIRARGRCTRRCLESCVWNNYVM